MTRLAAQISRKVALRAARRSSAAQEPPKARWQQVREREMERCLARFGKEQR